MARLRHGKTENAASPQPCIWKIGKYIRLSREDGNTESESITNQRKILDEHIPNYFHNNYEITDEYIDDGRTGTSDSSRPAFLRLVEDVKNGKINCIVTKNLSRAFRNSANQGKFLEEFIPLYNTRFISLYEPHIDTFLNPEVVHSLEVCITGFMNEQYAYKTSVDVRRTFDTKRKNGEFIGAFAPYGLMKNPDNKNSLMVDQEAAEIVRKIFHWFADDGMSKRGIAKRLNELGIPNPSAYKRQKGLKYCNPRIRSNDGLWSEKTVCSILLNEMYIGNMVQGKQRVISYKVHDRVRIDPVNWCIVENTHEGIIDRKTFAKAQSLHQKDTRTAPKQRTVHLFSGFLYCADCKKAMTRKSSKNHVYYHCSTYTRKSKTACTKHTVREDVLEKAVLLAIQRQISLVDNLTEIIEEIRNTPALHTEEQQIDHLLDRKEKELEKLFGIMDHLYGDWRTGELTETEYRRMRKRFELQINELQKTIAALETEKENLIFQPSSNDIYLTEFLNIKNISRLNRGILTALIKMIYVHENGELTIQFNFSDQTLQLFEHIEHSP